MNITAITKIDLNAIAEGWPEDLAQAKFHQFQTLEEAQMMLPETDILLVNGHVPDELLDQAHRLKWIQSLSAGVDKIPMARLAEKNILLTSMSGIHMIQMSEYAISLMLQWVRRAEGYLTHQRNSRWERIPTDELYGKTLGILGTGSIGQEIARKAKAFDMQVLGYNRSGGTLDYFDEVLTGDSGLDRILSDSDFIVSVMPDTPQTRHTLKVEQFQKMKRTAYFINIGRGSFIIEDDLITALNSGFLAGAGLDVFEQEPLSAKSPLWTMEQVTLTPHISGNSPHYMERAAVVFFDNLRRYRGGEKLRNLVDLKTGY